MQKKKKKIQIFWIPGIEMSKKISQADLIATNGSIRSYRKSVQIIAKQDVILLIQLFYSQKWQESWNLLHKKLYEIRRNVEPWLLSLGLIRKFEITIISQHIGHIQISHD